MNKYHHRLIPDDKSPLLSLLLIFAGLLIGYFVAGFFAFIFAFPFIDSLADMETILTSPKNEDWWVVMIMQMVTATVLFIVTPYVLIKFVFQSSSKYIISLKNEPFLKLIGLTVLATISFMVFNPILIEWNSNLILPEFLSDFENYIRAKEDLLAKLTEFLTDFKTFDKFLLTFLVIAIIPAVGEEYLFRGLIQTFLEKNIKNPHIAIILTGILFSAFHFQFYGFLPRAALGILFGYLFYYSGNLIYPIVAHFINNGLTIIMVYMFNTEVITYDIEQAETPSLLIISLFLATSLFFMFVFKKSTEKDLSHD